uniref:Thyrotropin-releasing hormone receptor n=1 Tax=Timema bartmani TaxID=61472 RepID=A0A7R9EQR3_9NEOP|nr:unnamed protein product [Timema bartmani]
MLFIAEYSTSGVYYDGTLVPVCLTQALTFWPGLYFVAVIVLFFLVPLLVLIVLYAIIAKHLMADPCSTTVKGTESYNARARKQVVLMLGTVVLSFFVCLIPFRVFTLWIIVVPHDPILGIAEYHYELYYDGSVVAVCLTQADTFWRALFFIFSNSFFFFVPLLILVVLYTIIARHLMTHPGIIANNNNSGSHVLRYRKQVVMMLGTVVLSFFICLLPFRALIFWIIIAPSETLYSLGAEAYYNLLFFCRIMFYLNSAVNPILYNLMSSKFRDGFMRLCGLRRRTSDPTHLGRRGTFNTTSTTTTTCSGNHRSSPESFWRRSVKSQRNSVKLFDAAKLSAPVGEVEKLLRNGSAARAAKYNSNKNNLIRPGLPEKCSCSITENGGSGVCSLQSHDESYV